MRRLAVFAGAFSLGTFLAQYLIAGDGRLLAGAVCLAASILGLLLPGLWRRRALLAGTALALAFGWSWLYARQVQAPMEALAGSEGPAQMTLLDYAEPTDYGAKVTVRLEGFPVGKAVYYGDETLLDLRPGQTATGLVRCNSASRIRDDDITNFTSKGVFLLLYQQGPASYGEGSAGSPRWWPVRLGRAMAGRIGELFDGDTAGFLTAILTGDKSGFSAGAASDLSEAGLYHILAVSGMHCGYLLTLATMLIGRHRRRLLAAIAAPLLVFYALLTGGSPSVVRACVMLIFLLAAPLFRREGDGPTALCAALFCILLANPFAAASISLQLSFGAMAGILWVTPRLNRLLTGKNPIRRFLSVSFSATIGALVFTVPLSAWYFGTLVLVSPISNLLCLWAASLVFILGLAALAASVVWMPLGMAVGFVPAALIRYILTAAHFLARLPGHALPFVNPYLWLWLGFVYLLFAAAWAIRDGGRRKYLLAAVLSAATLLAAVGLGRSRYSAGLDALALDVGQGQSILLASRGKTALVDCGSRNSWYDAGTIAADHLAAMGARGLDYLVLSHYDYDHVSGVETLLARVPVGTLLLPEGDGTGMEPLVLDLAERYGVAVTFVQEKTELPLGEASVTVFPPMEPGGGNESSLAVLAARGDWEMLITGDMDARAEEKLAASYALPDVEMLVVGHHGAATSTGRELLRAVTPETAIVSVGDNSYGHPTDEALLRLSMHGVSVCRTDMQGTVHVSVQ